MIGDPLCQPTIVRDLPAAGERVHHPVRVEPPLVASERQLVDGVRVDDVRHVEHRPAGVELAAASCP